MKTVYVERLIPLRIDGTRARVDTVRLLFNALTAAEKEVSTPDTLRQVLIAKSLFGTSQTGEIYSSDLMTKEESDRLLGPKWVLRRRTYRTEYQYGEDANFLTKRQYAEAHAKALASRA